MNTSVQICAKDGTQLYDVSNIRKLKKLNEKKPDTIVPDIVNKIVEYYTNNFQYTMPKEKLVFGFDDEEDMELHHQAWVGCLDRLTLAAM